MEPFLREDQCERVYGLRRREPRIHTQDRARERRFLAAVYWIDRSGAQWRFLPAAYGGWTSVYQRFARWDDLGVWERVFAGVADDPDLQRVTGTTRRKGSGARAAGSAASSTSWSTPSATR